MPRNGFPPMIGEYPITGADVERSIIGDGCVIKAGTKVANSIIGIRSLIGSDCIIDAAMMMGADYYETLEECEFVPGCLPMGVGDGSIIRRVGARQRRLPDWKGNK